MREKLAELNLVIKPPDFNPEIPKNSLFLT
jgi:hypothetical protein